MNDDEIYLELKRKTEEAQKAKVAAFNALSSFAQPQIPGLEDAVEVTQRIQGQRAAAIQGRDPELEQLYQLANSTPRDMQEALDTLNEIRDGIYRLLR